MRIWCRLKGGNIPLPVPHMCGACMQNETLIDLLTLHTQRDCSPMFSSSQSCYLCCECVHSLHITGLAPALYHDVSSQESVTEWDSG